MAPAAVRNDPAPHLRRRGRLRPGALSEQPPALQRSDATIDFRARLTVTTYNEVNLRGNPVTTDTCCAPERNE